MNKQELIDAVRNHPKLGKGSCSIMDECWSNNDIIDTCHINDLTKPEQIIQHIERITRAHYESYLNSFSGEGVPRPCILDGTEKDHAKWDEWCEQEKRDLFNSLDLDEY